MDRFSILLGVAGLSELPPAALEALAESMREETHACGTEVLVEGDFGERFYVIVSGRVEVSARQIPMSSLGPHEVFGEIALLSPELKRTATVRAQTELVLLSLSATDFNGLLQNHPSLRQHLEASARRLLRYRFLNLSTPFSGGGQNSLRHLAEQAEALHVEAGDVLIREGEAGDAAYCLVSGRLQVLREGIAVVQLEAGALFGEAALLTGDPRNATVQALEASELMVLHRSTVIAAMGEDPRVANACLSMLRLRERPRRKLGLEIFDGQSADGTPFTVLKDPKQGRYFHLSVEGRFLWDRLDGVRDLRALAIEFFVSFKRFAPDMVASIVHSLAAAGFVEVRSLAHDVQTATNRPAKWWHPVANALRKTLNWQLALSHCDPWMARWYAAGVSQLYTPFFLAVMALISVAGIAAFTIHAHSAWNILATQGALSAVAWLVPVVLFALLAHEAGHAFTVKACGRKVERMGLGWYWVTPVLFVDTSDMWLASKWQRIAVGLAGVCANLVLAGIAALLVPLLGEQAGALAWLFAALSYALVFFNLNPMLDYDGYHVLSDWLERPNLRRESPARLWRIVCHGRKNTDRASGLRADLLYVATMGAYLMVFGSLIFALAVSVVDLGSLFRHLPVAVSRDSGSRVSVWMVLERKAVLRAAPAHAVHYERRRPEETILHCLVREHLGTFVAQVQVRTGAGLLKPLPDPIPLKIQSPISNYAYDDEQVVQMFTALDSELKKARMKFHLNGSSNETGFKFKT